MESTEQNIQEARIATEAYIEAQRRAHLGLPGAVFHAPAISFDGGKEEFAQGERDDYVERAKLDAEEYCRARRQRLRPMRRKVSETPEEREAIEQALRYIEAKKKSVIKR
jgi:hypothetical protein